MESLNKCPFCGSEATKPEKVSGKTQRPLWEIHCVQFCVFMRRDSKGRVVRDWNQRDFRQIIEGGLELKQIAQALSNMAHMPYTWETVLDRITKGESLPFNFK